VDAARLAGRPIPPDDVLGLKTAGELPVVDSQRQTIDQEQAAGGGVEGSIDGSLRGAPAAPPPVVFRTPESDDFGPPTVDMVGRARQTAAEAAPAAKIEQRILEVSQPKLNAAGEMDANVFAGLQLAGSFPKHKGVQLAFDELAEKYGVPVTGDMDRDRQSVVTAIVNKHAQSLRSAREVPNEMATSHGSVNPNVDPEEKELMRRAQGAGRTAGESLSGQPFPERVGPGVKPASSFTPLEVFESGVEPLSLLDENGKPILDASGKPMVQFIQDGDHLIPRQGPFQRSKVFASRDTGGPEPFIDKGQEVSVLAVRRSGSDGNRSAQQKLFVLPVKGERGEQMYQIANVDGSGNELLSEAALRDMVETQGYLPFSGPKLPGLRDPALSFPPTPEAAGRQLVEYTKSGSPQGTVLAVKDLDRLKKQGTGEDFQWAVATAGGLDAAEAEGTIANLAGIKRAQVALKVRAELTSPNLTGPTDPEVIAERLRDLPEFYGLNDIELRQYASSSQEDLEGIVPGPGTQARITRFNEAYKRGLELYTNARKVAAAHDPETAFTDLSSKTDGVDPFVAQQQSMRDFFANKPVLAKDPKTGTERYTDPTQESLRQIEMGYGSDDTIPRTALGADPAENVTRIQDARHRASRLKQVIDRVAKLRQQAAQPVPVAADPSVASGSFDAAASPIGSFVDSTDTSASIGQLPFGPQGAGFPLEQPKGGRATWRNQTHDIPVVVDGIEDEVGTDGRRYARVRTADADPSAPFSYVPVDEVVWDSQDDTMSFLDRMFRARSAEGAFNFGTSEGSWAADQVRRAKARVDGKFDLGEGPITVSSGSLGSMSLDARRASIALGVRRRLRVPAGDGKSTFHPQEVTDELRKRPEFAGMGIEELAEYVVLPTPELERLADTAAAAVDATGTGSVAGPRVMTQRTAGGLPGNINAQRPIASQVDAMAGQYKLRTGQEGLDEVSETRRRLMPEYNKVRTSVRELSMAARKNALLESAVRQHLKDMQWRQKLVDDPDLAAQVAGTPDADPLPVSQRPEYQSIGKEGSLTREDLAQIESIGDEADAQFMLDELSTKSDELEQALGFVHTRRRNLAEQMGELGDEFDQLQTDVSQEVGAAERLAGAEDVDPSEVAVSRVQTGVDQLDQEADARFARAHVPADKDYGLNRSGQQMREDYQNALSEIYGPTVTRPLAARDFDTRTPDGRPGAQSVESFADAQKDVLAQNNPDVQAQMQADLDARAAAFAGDTGSAAEIVKHPSGKNQARLLKELAAATSPTKRLELVSELWRVRFRGMDSGWRAPMLPQFRSGKEHGINVLSAVSRRTGRPISDLVHETLARSAELRSSMSPDEMRHVGRLVQSDIEYANRFSPSQYDEAVGPPPPAGTPASTTGLRGLINRIKKGMGIGQPDAPAPKVEEMDPNDPLLMEIQRVQDAIPAAVGNEEIGRLSAKLDQLMQIADKVGQRPLRSYGNVYQQIQDLGRALEVRKSEPDAKYRQLRTRTGPPGLAEEPEVLDNTSRPGEDPINLGHSRVAKKPKLRMASTRDAGEDITALSQEHDAARERLEASEEAVAARSKEAKKNPTPETRAARLAAIEEQKEAKKAYKSVRGSLRRASTTVLITKEEADQLREWMTGKLTDNQDSVDRATGWPKLTVTVGNPGVFADGSGAGNITVERGYRTYNDKFYDKKTGAIVRSKTGDQPRDVNLQKRISGKVLKPIKDGDMLRRADIPQGMVAVDLDKDGNPILFHNSVNDTPPSPEEITLGDTTFTATGRKVATQAAETGTIHEESVRAKEGTPSTTTPGTIDPPAETSVLDENEANAPAVTGVRNESDLQPEWNYDESQLVQEDDAALKAKADRVRRAIKGDPDPAPAKEGGKPGKKQPIVTKKRAAGGAALGAVAAGAIMSMGGNTPGVGLNSGPPDRSRKDKNKGKDAAGARVRAARKQYTLMTPANPVPW
jgi:hypothetical protein